MNEAGCALDVDAVAGPAGVLSASAFVGSVYCHAAVSSGEDWITGAVQLQLAAALSCDSVNAHASFAHPSSPPVCAEDDVKLHGDWMEDPDSTLANGFSSPVARVCRVVDSPPKSS
jgi:hypothetical protein